MLLKKVLDISDLQVMAASISNANSINFDSDPDVTFRISDENCADVTVVIVEKDAMSDDESVLNCDSNDKCADTSLPMDVECLELMRDSSVQNANKTQELDSVFANLLADPTRNSHKHIYEDVETTLNTDSDSFKLHVVEIKDGIKKCQKQSKLTSLKECSNKVVQLVPQLSETIETQGSQPNVRRLKYIQCNEMFGPKSHLEIHEIDNEQFGSYDNSFPRQEIVIVKEEVLSDDEGILNDASSDEHYNAGGTSLPVNVECSEVENDDCVRHANNTLNHVTHGIRKHQKRINFVRSVNVDVKNVVQQQQLEVKPMTVPSYMAPAVQHQFRCGECSETFELKSRLVMHEISHEQFRRYSSLSRPNFMKQSAQDIYSCRECSANFELKSHFLLHELWHEKQRTKLCRCKSAPSASTSDLCTCVVRLCNLCGKSFFASVRLRNWASCMRCFLQINSKQKIKSATAGKMHQIRVKEIPSKRMRNKRSNRNFVTSVTDVKRLCYSCGNMCANVVKFGTSWMCYDCWNARLKRKGVGTPLALNNEVLQQESTGYPGLNCTYCLRLCPLQSLQPNHQCFHKSVYLKEYDDFDDYKIGCHFLLSSVEKPFEQSYLQNDLILFNQPTWFNDFNESEDEQDGEMVIDTTQVSDINDDSSSSKVILCDKTGKLIDLRSEADAAASDKI
jgi:hypothetical protein